MNLISNLDRDTAGRGRLLLKSSGKWLLRSSRIVTLAAVTSIGHAAKWISFVALRWRLRRMEANLNDLEAALGRRLYQLDYGDPEIRRQIAQLTEVIEDSASSKNKSAAKQQRRQLAMQLAASSSLVDAQPIGAEGENAAVQRASRTVEDARAKLEAQSILIKPEANGGRRYLLAGYGIVLSLIALVIGAFGGRYAGGPMASEFAAGHSSLTVSIEGESVRIDGKLFHLPMRRQQIIRLLGEPTRETKLTNTIQTWDALGIFIYLKPGSEYVHSIALAFGAEPDFPFYPTKPFVGEAVVDGARINARTTIVAVNRAKKGNPFRKQFSGSWTIDYPKTQITVSSSGSGITSLFIDSATVPQAPVVRRSMETDSSLAAFHNDDDFYPQIKSTNLGPSKLFVTSKMRLADGLFLSMSFTVVDKSEPQARRLNGLSGLVYLENVTTVKDYRLTNQTPVKLVRGDEEFLLSPPEEKVQSDSVKALDFLLFVPAELFAFLERNGSISVVIGDQAYELSNEWARHLDDLIRQVRDRMVDAGWAVRPLVARSSVDNERKGADGASSNTNKDVQILLEATTDGALEHLLLRAGPMAPILSAVLYAQNGTKRIDAVKSAHADQQLTELVLKEPQDSADKQIMITVILDNCERYRDAERNGDGKLTFQGALDRSDAITEMKALWFGDSAQGGIDDEDGKARNELLEESQFARANREMLRSLKGHRSPYQIEMEIRTADILARRAQMSPTQLSELVAQSKSTEVLKRGLAKDIAEHEAR